MIVQTKFGPVDIVAQDLTTLYVQTERGRYPNYVDIPLTVRGSQYSVSTHFMVPDGESVMRLWGGSYSQLSKTGGLSKEATKFVTDLIEGELTRVCKEFMTNNPHRMLEAEIKSRENRIGSIDKKLAELFTQVTDLQAHRREHMQAIQESSTQMLELEDAASKNGVLLEYEHRED